MSFVFFALKLFPVFGLSIAFVFFDLFRSFYRKKNKAWVGMLIFCFIFVLLTMIWIWFRGDKNADLWFGRMNDWLQHGR